MKEVGKVNNLDKFNVVNIKGLAKAAGTNYNRLRFNIVGRYKEQTITENEKTELANALHDEISKTFEFLGFTLPPHRRIK
jgi:hypothetical protein